MPRALSPRLVAVSLSVVLAASAAAGRAQPPGPIEPLRTLAGHTAAVRTVVFQPDGKLLATGAFDGTVRLWDVSAGREVAVLRGHGASPPTVPRHHPGVNSVAFFPDGRTLASGSLDGTVKLWDVPRQKELRTLTGHAGRVLCVATSPDGRTLASGSDDRTIRLWDAATGNVVRILTGHSAGVEAVVFDAAGQTLVSGSPDGTVKLWSAREGGPETTLRGGESVLSVASSAAGKTLAAGFGPGGVALWHLGASAEPWFLEGHGRSVHSVAFAPDGEKLASASLDGTVKLWDAGDGRKLAGWDAQAGGAWAVCFSPDGTLLATGGHDQTVKLWDLSKFTESVAGQVAPQTTAESPRAPQPQTDEMDRIADSGQGKAPLPNAAALEAAQKAASELFGTRFRSAKTAAAKTAVAAEMIEAALKLQDGTADQYALLKIAREIASGAGDAATALEAAEKQAERFDAPAAKLKAETLLAAAREAKAAAQHKAVAEAALQLVGDWTDASEIELPLSVCEAGRSAAQKSRQFELVKELAAKADDLKKQRKAAQEYREALVVMDKDPAEPAANLTAGRYLCFVVGDWEQGVPYLALGSDAGLKAVSLKELRGAALADEQAAIGDMWWDLAETKQGRERDSLRLRAGSWYRQAVPSLAGGLTGLKVKQRLQEIGRLGREIPAARPTPAATATVGEQGLQNGDFRNRLEGWTVEGSQTTFFVFALGDEMAVTSWGVRKDAETGRLSQTFTVPRNARTLRFFVHGGNAPASLYVALRRGDELIGRVTAKNDNTPFEVRWDITSARGAAVTLEVVDQNQNPWGFIAAHGFRIE